MFYSAVSFILGGHGDHSAGDGVDIDAGNGLGAGHDIDIGQGADLGAEIGDGIGADLGADLGDGVGADLDTGAYTNGTDAADNADSPSPFNPLVMASAITTFGAIGLISMKGFGLGDLASTIVALGFAGAIGAALFFGIVKFMYGSQSNSVFSLNDLIGTQADVITPLPEKGLGEIAYVANGTRYTLAARSLEGKQIKRGAAVIIREIAGSVAVVQQKLTIDDIELYDRADIGSSEAASDKDDKKAGGADAEDKRNADEPASKIQTENKGKITEHN